MAKQEYRTVLHLYCSVLHLQNRFSYCPVPNGFLPNPKLYSLTFPLYRTSPMPYYRGRQIVWSVQVQYCNVLSIWKGTEKNPFPFYPIFCKPVRFSFLPV